MTVDHSSMKLGRLPAKFDPRIPNFHKYIRSGLPAAPLAVDWSHPVTEWGMLANDRLGDCTAAAASHAVQTWTANASIEATITDQETVQFYSNTTGYNPSDPSSDQGGVELDVLNWWLKNNLAGHKLDAFATIDHTNRANIKDAIWLCGCIYIGVNLPVSAQTQDVWSVPPNGPTGDGAPGSWGGHALAVVSYSETELVCVTWGQLKRMTWDFFNSYTEEAYALLSKEWLKASGVSPGGFDYNTLVDDMKVIDDPMNKLHDSTDDPVLLELKWGDVTVDLNEAAATWALGLLSAACASYGQLDHTAATTWIGATGLLYATWRHFTKIKLTNDNTKVLVDAAADVISIFLKKKLR